MAMEGWFDDLRTPEDLLRKLEWEYTQWQKEPLNTSVAWNFFVTAEHLPDWLGQSDPQLPEDFPKKFKRKKPLLRICSHLANGGKHFRPGKHHTSVDSTHTQGGGWIPEGWVPAGWVPSSALVVDLTQREQRALALSEPSINALNLATQVLTFWQQYFSGASAP